MAQMASNEPDYASMSKEMLIDRCRRQDRRLRTCAKTIEKLENKIENDDIGGCEATLHDAGQYRRDLEHYENIEWPNDLDLDLLERMLDISSNPCTFCIDFFFEIYIYCFVFVFFGSCCTFCTNIFPTWLQNSF